MIKWWDKIEEPYRFIIAILILGTVSVLMHNGYKLESILFLIALILIRTNFFRAKFNNKGE